ncbi:hypothetical protein SUGI_0957430 [Cryptomeria japonica]|uniref:protein VACUOLELESS GAMETOPHYTES-like n=1 Tax=Cryptomeria japonica TaxID=3369 RepID=UPI0024149026|nr:protein VACUOLELESS GAMETOPHYTES-like [Cryptomeria japonica]GLJ45466.1 hypothetical protein SUGI_0957430 [Cryptomeria japonica]
MAGREEVWKHSRHEHGLRLREGLPRYRCSGCKALGADVGYKCGSCPNFVLHRPCADLADEYIHTLFPEHPFNFRRRTRLRHGCDACGKLLRGFVFQSSRGMRLHPLCMVVPVRFRHSGHRDHDLQLVVQDEGIYKCKNCDWQNTKWKYRCSNLDCGVRLDMNCAIVDTLRLSEYGITQVYKPSKLRRALGMTAEVGKVVSSAMVGVTPTVIGGGVRQ